MKDLINFEQQKQSAFRKQQYNSIVDYKPTKTFLNQNLDGSFPAEMFDLFPSIDINQKAATAKLSASKV